MRKYSANNCGYTTEMVSKQYAQWWWKFNCILISIIIESIWYFDSSFFSFVTFFICRISIRKISHSFHFFRSPQNDPSPSQPCMKTIGILFQHSLKNWWKKNFIYASALLSYKICILFSYHLIKYFNLNEQESRGMCMSLSETWILKIKPILWRNIQSCFHAKWLILSAKKNWNGVQRIYACVKD